MIPRHKRQIECELSLESHSMISILYGFFDHMPTSMVQNIVALVFSVNGDGDIEVRISSIVLKIVVCDRSKLLKD